MKAGRKAARTAVDFHAAKHTVLVGARFGRAGKVEIEVIRYKQIEQAVAIVIDPRASGAPVGPVAADPGLPGDIGKGAVAVIVVQHVLAPVGDEQVFEAVIIVVADTHAAGPAGTQQTGLLRYIGERPIAIVLVQAVGRALRRFAEARPRQDEDVEPTVVVVVEEGATAAHGLQDVVLVRHSAVNGGRPQA